MLYLARAGLLRLGLRHVCIGGGGKPFTGMVGKLSFRGVPIIPVRLPAEVKCWNTVAEYEAAFPEMARVQA